MVDMVNHPPHYAAHPRFTVECIELSRWMTFDAGNAFKYLWRFTQKNGLEDLQKTGFYLQDLCELILPSTPIGAMSQAVYPTEHGYQTGQRLFRQHIDPYIDRTDPLDRALGYLAMGAAESAHESYKLWSDQQ